MNNEPLTKGKLIWVKDADDWFYLEHCPSVSDEECYMFDKNDVRSAVEGLKQRLKRRDTGNGDVAFSPDTIIEFIDEWFPVFKEEVQK